MRNLVPSQVNGVIRYTFTTPAPIESDPWRVRGYNRWVPEGFWMRVEVATCSVAFTPLGPSPRMGGQVRVAGKRILANGNLSPSARGRGEKVVYVLAGTFPEMRQEARIPPWVEEFSTRVVRHVVAELREALTLAEEGL